MPTNGYLKVRVFTSEAQIPIDGASVTITQVLPDGGSRLIAVRLTDESGLVGPIAIPAPERADSQSAGKKNPFTDVDLLIDMNQYERVLIENVQIFAGEQSELNQELIPLSEYPEFWNETELIRIPPQEL